MADRGTQLPLFVQKVVFRYIGFPYIENEPVPVTSSLVLYSDWLRQTEVFRKLGKAFHYLDIRERVEAKADGILNGYGKSRLLPVLSTGVQGDYGTYKFALMIEVPADPDYERLAGLSTRLSNEVPEINRIVLLTAGQGITGDEIFVNGYFEGKIAAL